MNHDELQRMMGTAGLGVWTPAGDEAAPPTDEGGGLWARLEGVRTRLSALAGRLGRSAGIAARG